LRRKQAILVAACRKTAIGRGRNLIDSSAPTARDRG
jgi:hypothetical protein